MRKCAPDGGHSGPIPSRELPSAHQPRRDPPDPEASLRLVLPRLAVLCRKPWPPGANGEAARPAIVKEW
jgi:hypothetical protein